MSPPSTVSMQTFFQGLGKAFDLVVAVVHAHRDAGALEVEHLASTGGGPPPAGLSN